MSREWQMTQLTEYVMPNAVYYQTLWAVRDLERMENRLDDLLNDRQDIKAGMVNESSKKYSGKRSRVENRAMETAILQERIDGIHQALVLVPPEYRDTILDNIVLKESFSEKNDKRWKLWKQKFLYTVAHNLSIM